MLMLSISERKKKKKLILDADAIEKFKTHLLRLPAIIFYNLDFIAEWYFTTQILQLQWY